MSETRFTPGLYREAISPTAAIKAHLDATLSLSTVALVAKDNEGELPSPVALIFLPNVLDSRKASEELVGNMKLFAAAPDLYAACQSVLDLFEIWEPEGTMCDDARKVQSEIEAALDKARGER